MFGEFIWHIPGAVGADTYGQFRHGLGGELAEKGQQKKQKRGQAEKGPGPFYPIRPIRVAAYA
jgi:hypothetical protein